MKKDESLIRTINAIYFTILGLLLMLPFVLGRIGFKIFYGIYFSFFYLQLRTIHYSEIAKELEPQQAYKYWLIMCITSLIIIIGFNFNYWGKAALGYTDLSYS